MYIWCGEQFWCGERFWCLRILPHIRIIHRIRIVHCIWIIHHIGVLRTRYWGHVRHHFPSSRSFWFQPPSETKAEAEAGEAFAESTAGCRYQDASTSDTSGTAGYRYQQHQWHQWMLVPAANFSFIPFSIFHVRSSSSGSCTRISSGVGGAIVARPLSPSTALTAVSLLSAPHCCHLRYRCHSHCWCQGYHGTTTSVTWSDRKWSDCVNLLLAIRVVRVTDHFRKSDSRTSSVCENNGKIDLNKLTVEQKCMIWKMVWLYPRKNISIYTNSV